MKKTIIVKGINVKNGTSKQGKEWTRYSFYDGEQWFNMWAEKWNADLQNTVEDDEIEICFIKKDYKGKPQYEIINPSTPEIVEQEKKEMVINEMREAIKKLKNRLEICEARMDEMDEKEPEWVREDSDGTRNDSDEKEERGNDAETNG